MQQLLRDVRYMKIAVDGKIPPVSDNDRENFLSLIKKGKSKVSADFGTSSTGNLLENRAWNRRLSNGNDIRQQ